jgi:hypothetical protein
MNCWGIIIYFTKSRFSLNGGYIVYMELLSGHEKIITKCGNIKFFVSVFTHEHICGIDVDISCTFLSLIIALSSIFVLCFVCMYLCV